MKRLKGPRSQKKNHKDSGQAVVEFLLLFGLLVLLAVGLVQTFGSAVGKSVGSLAFYLSQQLSVGVCKVECLGNSYNNKAEN